MLIWSRFPLRAPAISCDHSSLQLKTHWLTPASQLAQPPTGHLHTHGYISAYAAVCVPTANTLLYVLPRKLCHFIFVPVTISHVFSGCGWIIPRGANACRQAEPRRAGPRPSWPPKKMKAEVRGLGWTMKHYPTFKEFLYFFLLLFKREVEFSQQQ